MFRRSVLTKAIYLFSLFLTVVGSKAYAFDQMGVSDFSLKSLNKQDSQVSMGILHSNTYHSSFDQTFYSLEGRLNTKLGSKGSLVAEGFGLLKLQGEGSSFYSLKEFYYKRDVNSKVSYSVGRKINEWSTLNDYLPTGFWNNAWDFNKAAPKEEGLFGAFVDFKISKNSQIHFFASPISVPKFTEHYQFNENGGVDATTTWFVAPPSEVDYQGATYDTKYDLDLNIADVVLNPQVGFIYDLLIGERSFLKTSYLYAPSKDVDMSIDFALNAAEEDTPVDITVDPSVGYLHKMGLEMGFKWSEGSQTTFSVNHRERVNSLDVDPSGQRSVVGLSSGSVYQIAHDFSLFKKRLKVQVHALENTNTKNLSSGELDEFLLDSLSVPFRFRRGGGLKASYSLTSSLSLGTYAFYDVQNEGVLGDLKIKYNTRKLSFVAGVNFVEALSAESKEFYKDFRQNDSYHIGVSHVF